MGYRLKDSEAVSDEVRRVVEQQIDRALAEIDDGKLDVKTTIHQVRLRCKKIRAVLRLARGPLQKDGTYKVENAFFRDTAADLSELRDAEVLIKTHDALTRDVRNPDVLVACAAVRERLAARHGALTEAPVEARLQTARERLLEGRARVPDWAWRVRNFQGLEPGLKETYRRGRRSMNAAYRLLSDEQFHDWRKRVKYHWYACRLLCEIWPAEMNIRRREAARLAALLGDEHDLAVYRATLEAQTHWFGENDRRDEMLAAADQRRTNLRRRARALGMRLYAEKPARLTARFADYWRAWRAEND